MASLRDRTTVSTNLYDLTDAELRFWQYCKKCQCISDNSHNKRVELMLNPDYIDEDASIPMAMEHIMARGQTGNNSRIMPLDDLYNIAVSAAIFEYGLNSITEL